MTSNKLKLAVEQKENREKAWKAVKDVNIFFHRLLSIAHGNDQTGARALAKGIRIEVSVPGRYCNWELSTFNMAENEVNALFADPDVLDVIYSRLRAMRLEGFRRANRSYIDAVKELREQVKTEFPVNQ